MTRTIILALLLASCSTPIMPAPKVDWRKVTEEIRR